MKVLNLYAGIGGNRKLWENVEVTSIEYDEKIAEIYKDNYPGDTVIVADAHEYLLNHYSEFDMIWASPPCQTHSSARQNLGVKSGKVNPVYPDMKLYQEIIFLQHNCEVPFVVENVIPYYKPLIAAQLVGRHYFGSNKVIRQRKFENDDIKNATIEKMQNRLGFDLSKYKIENKRQILRNCVNPELGLYIFNQLHELPGSCKVAAGTLFNIT